MAEGEQIYKPKFEFTDSPTTNPGLQIATTKYDVINGDFINSENILSEYWDNGNQNFTIEDWGDGVYLIYKDDVAMGFTDQNGYDYLMGNSQENGTGVQPQAQLSSMQQLHAASQRVVNESKGRGSYTTNFMGHEALIEPIEEEGVVHVSYIENGRRTYYVLDQETGEIVERIEPETTTPTTQNPDSPQYSPEVAQGLSREAAESERSMQLQAQAEQRAQEHI